MNIRIRRSSGAPVILSGSEAAAESASELLDKKATQATAAPPSQAAGRRGAPGRKGAPKRGHKNAQPDLFTTPREASPSSPAAPGPKRVPAKRQPAAPAKRPSPPAAGARGGRVKAALSSPPARASETKQRAPAVPKPAPARSPAAAPRSKAKAGKRGGDAPQLQLPPGTPPVETEPDTASVLETAAAETSPASGAAAPRRRATAESMATKQRDISVSEFFMKNRHLLGFDSPARALLTTVKEALDNSLDACEEAGILPSLRVELVEITEERYRVVVEDNGPGIVKAQIPKVFGKLLYGSKFHRLRQSRGQQGIGVSAAGMYGQMTTGRPIVITSRTGKGRPAHHFEIVIDTAHNTPNVVKDEQIDWELEHGTRVEIELAGTYKAGRRSVDEYIEQVGIANPHAEIRYQPPKGRPLLHIPRATEDLPREPLEIKPHPYGVELGMMQKILQDSEARTLTAALQQEFSRVTPKVAEEILAKAMLAPRAKPRDLKHGEIERLHKAIPSVKIFAPPTACVVPIGEELVRKGLEREIAAEFYTSCTRPPAVYRGNPFQVEAGLAYGGELRDRGANADEDSVHTTAKQADAQEGPITVLRLANRVPLQYQQSACATFKSVIDTNWRSYGLTQPRGSLPQGPMVLLVHIASVWVPFTSESKEAVAHYPEILKEMQLALQECGRRLGSFLRRREAERHEQRRRSIFEMYIGELVESLGKLTPVDRQKLQRDLLLLARQHTGDEGEVVEAMLAPTRKVATRAGELSEDEAQQAAAAPTATPKTAPPRGAAGGAAGKRRGKRRPATSQLELLDGEEVAS